MGNAAPATKAVSRLVLLDGQFSRLPSVLGEGRKIIANIERVTNPVSYTHLDVYKRQTPDRGRADRAPGRSAACEATTTACTAASTSAGDRPDGVTGREATDVVTPEPDAAAALAWVGADAHANPRAAALAEGFEHPNPLPPVAVLALSLIHI